MGLLSHGLQKPPRTRGMKSGESKVVLGTKLLEEGLMSTSELPRDLQGTKGLNKLLMLSQHPSKLLSQHSPTASKGKVE
jgi:hypothetical protein